MISECEIAADKPSNTACEIVPRMATMKAAIIVLECPGSRPWSAPSRIALGMKSHAWAALCCNRSESWAMLFALASNLDASYPPRGDIARLGLHRDGAPP